MSIERRILKYIKWEYFSIHIINKYRYNRYFPYTVKKNWRYTDILPLKLYGWQFYNILVKNMFAKIRNNQLLSNFRDLNLITKNKVNNISAGIRVSCSLFIIPIPTLNKYGWSYSYFKKAVTFNKYIFQKKIMLSSRKCPLSIL